MNLIEVVGTSTSVSLREEIIKNKPSLAKSSLLTYESTLKTLCKKMNIKDPSMVFFNDTQTILKFIEENYKSINTRKSLLTALYVLTLCPPYKDTFLIDCNTCHKQDMKNEMTEKQKQNWIPYSSIVTTWNNHKTKNIESIDFIILSLMCGVFIPPRRLLDWVELKHKNYDLNTDNYIENNYFVFNKYKTFKKYGKQTIPIPKELVDILTNYIQKHCKTDYILTNLNNDKMTINVLNNRINKIFGKKVGCGGIRHSFISEKVLPFMPKLTELHHIAWCMGHSISTQMIYRKDFDSSDSE